MTSFVPSLTSDSGAAYRLSKLEEIKIKIFDLVYYGHFGYSELGSMTSMELNWYHSHLIETKDKENKAKEQAMRDIQNKQNQVKQNYNINNASYRNHGRRRR